MWVCLDRTVSPCQNFHLNVRIIFVEDRETQPLVECDGAGVDLQNLKPHWLFLCTSIQDDKPHTRRPEPLPLVFRKDEDLVDSYCIGGRGRGKVTDVNPPKLDYSYIL